MRTINDASDYEVGYAIGFLSARGEEFSTIDVIRKILGTYLCDQGVPAAESPNALFGKFLSANAADLKIERLLPDRPAQDDEGNRTTTAYWRPLI